jgi:hypothetical protein
MQNVKVNFSATRSYANHYWLVAIILIVFISLGAYFFNVYRALRAPVAPAQGISLSQKMFEERYGLRVNLAAITSAGGMVDLRLKMLDADKAKVLLQDKNNFPSLVVPGTGEVLKVSEYTLSQEIEYVNGGGIFLLFPNAHSVFQPGDPVIVRFGDTSIEPLPLK